MAALQVLQGSVRDQGTVVQLDHLQVIVGAGAAAKMPDAVVRDQLAVGQALQRHSRMESLIKNNSRNQMCVRDRHSPGLVNGDSGWTTV